MNIIVDAFGGDNSPDEVIKGCAMAVEKLGVNIILAGDKQKIKQSAEKNNISLNGMEILHADSVIDIHEEPTEIIKGRSDCSMAVGLKAPFRGQRRCFRKCGKYRSVGCRCDFHSKENKRH